MRTSFFAGALTAVSLLVVLGAARSPTRVTQDGVEARVAKLEAWRESVEKRLPLLKLNSAPSPSQPSPESQPARDAAHSIIDVRVANKKYEKVSYQDFVSFEVWYIASGLKRDARSLKGRIEFADLFGEVKFRLNVTLEKGICAGATFFEKESGFEYNQFVDSHQWMLATDFADMRVSMKVTSVLYRDGTIESF